MMAASPGQITKCKDRVFQQTIVYWLISRTCELTAFNLR